MRFRRGLGFPFRSVYDSLKVLILGVSMRPKQPTKADHDDLFRARLDQIINMRHELVVLADKIDWTWLDAELAGCFSDQGRPAEPVRFMIGMFLLKHTAHRPRHRRLEEARSGAGHGRHHGATQERHLPDRRQAPGDGDPPVGQAGQAARRAATPVL